MSADPPVPRTLCAGATPLPAKMEASAGRPTPCTAVSAAAAGPASTAMCPASPVRWPHSSEVTGRPCLPHRSPEGGTASPHARLHLLPPAGVKVAHLCQHGGLCVDAGNTHHCRCQAGYTGSYCEDEVDECSPSPCQNGATCTDYLGGYSCKVRAGQEPGVDSARRENVLGGGWVSPAPDHAWAHCTSLRPPPRPMGPGLVHPQQGLPAY